MSSDNPPDPAPILPDLDFLGMGPVSRASRQREVDPLDSLVECPADLSFICGRLDDLQRPNPSPALLDEAFFKSLSNLRVG